MNHSDTLHTAPLQAAHALHERLADLALTLLRDHAPEEAQDAATTALAWTRELITALTPHQLP